MRRLVICVVGCILCTSVQAFESTWVWLASYRILEPSCRSDIQSALKGLSTSDLEEAIEIARQREVVFTSRVKTAGDAARAQNELDDYHVVMVAQLEGGLKTMGCPRVIQKLGLNLPKPMTKEQVTEMARSAPLQSSERTDSIPAADRIGTKAAYQLQKNHHFEHHAKEELRPELIASDLVERGRSHSPRCAFVRGHAPDLHRTLGDRLRWRGGGEHRDLSSGCPEMAQLQG
ncbi:MULTISPECIES: hypothetical protein [unclassified Bosea (in: a-proteobacteria)]|uniref:hypothetical protein n=1 Tax=unclassified Bosea (in: a-proteobacteria) TaxID=2653178 RepID=UPI000F7F5FEB|nr:MULTISPECIES: hypothetical protein [unclassified Bosea (in: a-proteobacteria)]